MAMTLVSTVTVGSGGATSIEFTNIPQTGKDLLVLISGRSNSTSIEPNYRFNGDTGNNYRRRELYGDGSAVGSFAPGLVATLGLYATSPSGSTANTFANAALTITNYTSSVAKSISNDSVTENNATTAYQQIQASSYAGTSPITSINFYGLTFVQHTTASLYIIS